MSERIQKVMDGDLPPDALTPAEVAELERCEEAADRVLAPLRAESTPDVTAAVMERVATLPAPGGAVRNPAWSRILEWVWTPRQLAVRPAWGLAAAALATVLLWAPGPGAGGEIQDSAAPAAAQPVFVHFRLDAGDATSVHLAGDFTDWAPRHSLRQTAPGVWTVVVPVDAGVHEYAFVVDGERWVADPLAPRMDDGFGGQNSRLDVVIPEPQRSL